MNIPPRVPRAVQWRWFVAEKVVDGLFRLHGHESPDDLVDIVLEHLFASLVPCVWLSMHPNLVGSLGTLKPSGLVEREDLKLFSVCNKIGGLEAIAWFTLATGVTSRWDRETWLDEWTSLVPGPEAMGSQCANPNHAPTAVSARRTVLGRFPLDLPRPNRIVETWFAAEPRPWSRLWDSSGQNVLLPPCGWIPEVVVRAAGSRGVDALQSKTYPLVRTNGPKMPEWRLVPLGGERTDPDPCDRIVF